jgi:hypothetical protein
MVQRISRKIINLSLYDDFAEKLNTVGFYVVLSALVPRW